MNLFQLKIKKVKNDFASIFEITKERIIRASKKLTENYPNKDFKSGFKIFKTCENFLPSSSYRELKQLTLSQLDIPSAMTGFDEAQLQDILTTWKGLDKILLSENLNTVSLGDYLAYSFGHVLYLVNKMEYRCLKRLDSKSLMMNMNSKFLNW